MVDISDENTDQASSLKLKSNVSSYKEQDAKQEECSISSVTELTTLSPASPNAFNENISVVIKGTEGK